MSSHLRLDDGTTWPDPGDPGDVQWQLRYGGPTREQMVFAASVMAAYGRLGLGPRSSQLAALRRAAKAARQPCAGSDPTCPCQDGETTVYVCERTPQ